MQTETFSRNRLATSSELILATSDILLFGTTSINVFLRTILENIRRTIGINIFSFSESDFFLHILNIVSSEFDSRFYLGMCRDVRRQFSECNTFESGVDILIVVEISQWNISISKS